MWSIVDRKVRLPRIWSNNELKKISSLFYGSVINVSGWKDLDIAIAVYAHGAALLANEKSTSYSGKDEENLIIFENIVKEKFSNFKIKKRKSL